LENIWIFVYYITHTSLFFNMPQGMKWLKLFEICFFDKKWSNYHVFWQSVVKDVLDIFGPLLSKFAENKLQYLGFLLFIHIFPLISVLIYSMVVSRIINLKIYCTTAIKQNNNKKNILYLYFLSCQIIYS
jgi:hypothetical protein